nr:GntR family transcriptional regulator [Sinorhizobium meliloti]
MGAVHDTEEETRGPVYGISPSIDPSSRPFQLYLSPGNAIAEGQLTTGQRLPSTRLASTEWKISRGVIAEACEILITKGFAVARQRSGTYVASSIPDGAARVDQLGGEGAHPIRRSVSAAATRS